MKTSITNNTFLAPWFLENNDPISSRSAAQTLSLSLAETPLFLNFLTTDFRSSWANCHLQILPFCLFLSGLILFPYQKICRSYSSIPFELAISLKTLSEIVLSPKFLFSEYVA